MSERTPIGFSEAETDSMVLALIDSEDLSYRQHGRYWKRIDREYADRGFTDEAAEDLVLEAGRRLHEFKRSINRGLEQFHD